MILLPVFVCVFGPSCLCMCVCCWAVCMHMCRIALMPYMCILYCMYMKLLQSTSLVCIYAYARLDS